MRRSADRGTLGTDTVGSPCMEQIQVGTDWEKLETVAEEERVQALAVEVELEPGVPEYAAGTPVHLDMHAQGQAGLEASSQECYGTS